MPRAQGRAPGTTCPVQSANANRQLGDGTKFDRAVPVQVSLPPQKFVAIATQEDGSFALSESGERWGWGYMGGLNASNPGLTQHEVPEGSWRYGRTWRAEALWDLVARGGPLPGGGRRDRRPVALRPRTADAPLGPAFVDLQDEAWAAWRPSPDAAIREWPLPPKQAHAVEERFALSQAAFLRYAEIDARALLKVVSDLDAYDNLGFNLLGGETARHEEFLSFLLYEKGNMFTHPESPYKLDYEEFSYLVNAMLLCWSRVKHDPGEARFVVGNPRLLAKKVKALYSLGRQYDIQSMDTSVVPEPKPRPVQIVLATNDEQNVSHISYESAGKYTFTSSDFWPYESHWQIGGDNSMTFFFNLAEEALRLPLVIMIYCGPAQLSIADPRSKRCRADLEINGSYLWKEQLLLGRGRDGSLLCKKVPLPTSTLRRGRNQLIIRRCGDDPTEQDLRILGST